MTGGALLPWLIFSVAVALKLWQAVRLGREFRSRRSNPASPALERIRASLERAWELNPDAKTVQSPPMRTDQA